ncbi:MAG: hypothetical protein F6K53_37420 [Moorea sp. SIO4A1]|uniref:hypothetical protein n=1 Tax=Moorena sp. SIO4A1 TaxID=2607835 RepID=UPI00144CFC5B|nr:hypothetical protein [Moorena sp. SIO4A1]NEQ62747.1 hypothetical protein [Moorena sp. SIO4A1]
MSDLILAHTAAVAPVESFGFFSQNTATGQLGLKNSSPFYRLSIRAAPIWFLEHIWCARGSAERLILAVVTS